MSEQAAPVDLAPDMTIRVAGRVHRRLLTLQYERKMAGEFVSLSEVIEQRLDDRNSTAEEMADAFMEWFTEGGLVDKCDADETMLLAEAFGAGCRFATRRLT